MVNDMNKEQQIEEMANEIEIIGFCDGSIDFYKTASRLYRKGYRKVVFCKDCEHYICDKYMKKHCANSGIAVDPDDFCSYGAKKE